MKKALSLLLVLTMVLSLAACGGTKEADNDATSKTEAAGDSEDAVDPIELTFWAHQEGPWNDSYEAIAAAYKAENPNVTIKFEFYPYDEFESKIQTSLIAKKGGADMYEIWGGWGVDFASTGALAPMPADMAKEIMADSYPSTYGSLEYDGKLYGMPMEFNIESGAMLVNLNILNEKGLSIPTTWEDLISTAKAGTVLNGEEYAVKGFDFANWDSVTYLWISMILSNGGQYLNEDGTIDFTSAEAKVAFEELVGLVVDEQVTDLFGLTGGGELEGFQQLYAGEALFVPRGPWCIAEGIETFELTFDEDFTYAAMPWAGPEEKFAAETGWALAVNGASEKQVAAFDFIEYFYSDEVLLAHNIKCGMIPPKKSVAQSSAYVEAMPFAKPLLGILDDAQYIGYFNSDVVKEAINDAFVDHIAGVYGSVDETLTTLNETINSQLK